MSLLGVIILSLMFVVACCGSDPEPEPYNIRHYTPPPTTGDVYVVIDKKNDQIYLSAVWGPWEREEKIDLSNYDGLVLHLKHLKNDSVQLTIKTDGAFVKKPYQGEAPAEWDNEQYMNITWDDKTEQFFKYKGQFFKRKGQDILGRNGHPFLIKGIALSGWLNTEAYMLKLNEQHDQHIGSDSDLRSRIHYILGNEIAAREFWDTYQANFVTEQDIAEFAARGFNTIRLPFNYRLLSPLATPNEYSDEGFKLLDTAVEWCKNHGIYVILDMHCCPGGQSREAHADPEHTEWQSGIEKGVACLWEFNQEYYERTGRTPEFNKDRIVDLWWTIANRYKKEEWIIGYELMNEPDLPSDLEYPNSDALRDLLILITDAIRETDKNHIIFVQGEHFSSTFEGLLPTWDDNMALMFHKYWRPTEYREIQPYIETANHYNLPLCMSESGENSNPWFYEFVQLLEGNNIGWCWWGYKKVEQITSAYSVTVTSDYQFVIDNFWNPLSIDPIRAKRGLMDLANSVATENCHYQPGYFASLLDPNFNISPIPYTMHEVPGIIHCVNYDIGNQNIGYSDTRYKNEKKDANPWNEGWSYRNDGVDIQESSDSHPSSCGYNVGWTDDGECMRYTINVSTEGNYSTSFRVATENDNGAFELLLDGNDLSDRVYVNNTGGYQNWITLNHDSCYLPTGKHILELRILTGGFNISWIQMILIS